MALNNPVNQAHAFDVDGQTKFRDGVQAAAALCEREADACMKDIVPGDDAGKRLASERAGALLTAAKNIRRIRAR